MDYVQSLLRKTPDNVLTRLAAGKHVELEAFTFDGNTTSQLRKLSLAPSGQRRLDPAHLADQLSTKGQVTALGAPLYQMGQQFGTSLLAVVVLISGFAHDSGPAPVGDGAQSPTARLGVPFFFNGTAAT